MDKHLDLYIRSIKAEAGIAGYVDILKSDDKYKKLEDACKSFLIYMGYKVSDPELCEINVQTQDNLIHLFYHFRNFYHPEDYHAGRMPISIDRATAKHFVNARRQDETISKKIALLECARIIEVVFKHEKEFNFNIPINFSLFGQNKMAWVTQVALRLIEREKNKEIEKVMEEQEREYEETYMDDEKGKPFGDLDKILESVENR